MTMPADDEWTELVDCDFPRIDLVGKAANGTRFLIAKAGASAGVLEPGFVRDLIAKAEPEGGERVSTPPGVTLTGSPADIAAFIHKAVRPAEPAGIAKGKYTAEDKRKMLAAGHAIKNENGDPSYPIGDKDDLGKAVRAVGRGGPDHDRIRAYVIRRAKALGASSEIPDNWAADGSLKEGSVSKAGTVTKADPGDMLDAQADGGMDGMDPTVPLAEPGTDAPGDPADPGSPAWEAIDAATAQKWTSILARAGAAVGLLSEREMLEAASADPDDMGNAMDLQDVCCAIDYAISVLAPFAVAEQSEADCGAMDMAVKSAAPAAAVAVAEAMAGFDPAPLAVIETFSAIVAKSGRVLSSVNEAHIREAHQRLNTVLQSLPPAPAADDGDAVAKETAVTDPQAAPAAPEPPAAAAPAAPVAKADKPPMVAVYSQSGELVGIADPADITPIQGASPPAAKDGGDDSAGAVPGAPADPPADPADMTPAPPADAGTPVAGTVPADDDVTKAAEAAPQPADDAREVLKSLAARLETALGALGPAQDIAKQADVIADLSAQVETLKSQVVTLGEQPAMPRVFTNGAVPPPGTLRGQDRAPAGSPPADVAKAAELRGTLYHGTAPEQRDAADAMQQMAIDRLAQIHAAPRG